ncbi:HlyD family efflux transporter periplasmic adaptor subunit [Klebsiella indica]|uniref:HlyD family efflux transporter periplasmic adaptor subunit n=1 Tax=Klebsiella TaxID=570 RepID=UPI002803CE04|nr:HlyD family efflux transporter periplasmic adaptor subunit [uncultured Klebsiella sp.]
MTVTAPSTGRLAPLRDELILHPGPASWDGSPTWTLEDPLRDRYFRIGWLEMALLSHWSLGDVGEIVAEINQQLPVSIDEEDVRAFGEFLSTNALTRRCGDQAIRQMTKQLAAGKIAWWRYVLRHYLFLRIPLLHPDNFLQRTLPWVAMFYRPGFWLATVIAGMTGLLFASQQWETFRHTFLHFFTLEGAVLAGLTLCVTKFLHESGHAYTCKRYGAKVSSLGVALMVMMPVLYTDTSSAWRLASRRQRLVIGAAGMLTELAIAAWATLAWSFLPDGMARSAAFMLATTTWMMTLAVNLSPLMRFDGYFLLSDCLGIGNLQQRGFALGRWQLREWLFGLRDMPPEPLPNWLRRTLTGYAFATWIYRLFLFTGIALLVYHMTFRLLGMALFAIEIGYFVLLPIANELRAWHHRRKDYRMNRNVILTLGGIFLTAMLLLLPWQRTVYAPGLLRAEQQGSLYMPMPAQVEQIRARAGQRVEKGQILFTLRADAVQHQRQQLDLQLATLTWQQSFQTLNNETLQTHQRVRQERDAARQRHQVLQQQLTDLAIRAPFSGRLADIAWPLAAGEWLGQGEWLATVTGTQGALVEAFVPENAWLRLQIGAKGVFYPHDTSRSSIAGEVVEVEHTAVRDLRPVAELASLYGGDIAALSDSQQRLTPEQAVYRVVLRLPPDTPVPEQAVIGTLAITGTPRILAVSLWQRLSSVVIREFSF